MPNTNKFTVEVLDRGSFIAFKVRGHNYSWIMWPEHSAYGGPDGEVNNYSLRSVIDAIAALQQ